MGSDSVKLLLGVHGVCCKRPLAWEVNACILC
jgi:hypothetical protein